MVFSFGILSAVVSVIGFFTVKSSKAEKKKSFSSPEAITSFDRIEKLTSFSETVASTDVAGNTSSSSSKDEIQIRVFSAKPDWNKSLIEFQRNFNGACDNFSNSPDVYVLRQKYLRSYPLEMIHSDNNVSSPERYGDKAGKVINDAQHATTGSLVSVPQTPNPISVPNSSSEKLPQFNSEQNLKPNQKDENPSREFSAKPDWNKSLIEFQRNFNTFSYNSSANSPDDFVLRQNYLRIYPLKMPQSNNLKTSCAPNEQTTVAKPSRKKKSHGFRNFLKRSLDSSNPINSESKSVKRVYWNLKSKPVHSVESPTQHVDCSVQGMSAEEQEEFLKSVISYCKA